MKVIELFSGIGAQVQALKNIGVDHEIVGVSEIDRKAMIVYEALHGKTVNFGDICKIESLPESDLWTYSFPCQDLSISGKQLGIKEGTRSGLLWEVGRLLKVAFEQKSLPKSLLMENVPNILSKTHMPQFQEWLDFLESLGYHTDYGCLNASLFVPQNRERAFAVSCLNEKFPFFNLKIRSPFLNKTVLSDVLCDDLSVNLWLDTKYEDRIRIRSNPKPTKNGIVQLGKAGEYQNDRIYSRSGNWKTLSASGGNLGGNGGGLVDFVLAGKTWYRRLSARECWILMGFTKSQYDIAKQAGIPDGTLAKQAGNSIVVPVLEMIFRFMFV